MLSILYDLLTAALLVAVIGYASPKFFLYGSATTAALTVSYILLPSLDGAEPITTMAPKLMAIWTIYPRAAMGTYGQADAVYGDLGMVVTAIIFALLLPPYLIGIWLGIQTWPEIRVLGWVL